MKTKDENRSKSVLLHTLKWSSQPSANPINHLSVLQIYRVQIYRNQIMVMGHKIWQQEIRQWLRRYSFWMPSADALSETGRALGLGWEGFHHYCWKAFDSNSNLLTIPPTSLRTLGESINGPLSLIVSSGRLLLGPPNSTKAIFATLISIQAWYRYWNTWWHPRKEQQSKKSCDQIN